jgi:hypothetical protein
MPLDHATILKIDKARMGGASAGDVLGGLQKAGVPDPERVFREYAETPMPDGRLRSQVNLGDPAEWE